MNSYQNIYRQIKELTERTPDNEQPDIVGIINLARQNGLPLFVTERLIASAYNSEVKILSGREGIMYSGQTADDIYKSRLEIDAIQSPLKGSSVFIAEFRILGKDREHDTQTSEFDLTDYPSKDEFISDFQKLVGTEIILTPGQRIELANGFNRNEKAYRKDKKTQKSLWIGAGIIGCLLLISVLLFSGIFADEKERKFDEWKAKTTEEMVCVENLIADLKDGFEKESLKRSFKGLNIQLTSMEYPSGTDFTQSFDEGFQNLKRELEIKHDLEVNC